MCVPRQRPRACREWSAGCLRRQPTLPPSRGKLRFACLLARRPIAIRSLGQSKTHPQVVQHDVHLIVRQVDDQAVRRIAQFRSGTVPSSPTNRNDRNKGHPIHMLSFHGILQRAWRMSGRRLVRAGLHRAFDGSIVLRPVERCKLPDKPTSQCRLCRRQGGPCAPRRMQSKDHGGVRRGAALPMGKDRHCFCAGTNRRLVAAHGHAPGRHGEKYAIGRFAHRATTFRFILLPCKLLPTRNDRAKKSPRKACVPGGQRTRCFSGSDWTLRTLASAVNMSEARRLRPCNRQTLRGPQESLGETPVQAHPRGLVSQSLTNAALAASVLPDEASMRGRE